MKNTRLVYIDKQNLDIYNGLEPEQFKEFFMRYFTYQLGDNVEIGDFSNSALYALFKMYQTEKIDPNEKKWVNRGNTSRENGAKSMGRPRNIILENNNEIEKIISTFSNGDYEGGNQMLFGLFRKLGYQNENDDTKYITSYITNKVEKLNSK